MTKTEKPSTNGFDPSYFVENAQLTVTTSQLEDFLSKSLNEDLIAVDTESAGFYKYKAQTNLIQIATRKQAAIIDPQAISDMSPLSEFGSKTSCRWLFHWGSYDAAVLFNEFGVIVKKLFDTQVAATFIGLGELGLSSLAARYLGFSLDKKLQRCNWSKRPLTGPMIEYALLDAICLIPIMDLMVKELEALNRVEWVEEEFDFLAKSCTTAKPIADKRYEFMIKGSQTLSVRSLGVLKTVWELRDNIARKHDRAPFMILPNYALIDIARQAPRTMAGLRVLKNIGGHFLDRHGDELLLAINAGLKAEPILPERKRRRKSENCLSGWETSLLEAMKAERDKTASKLKIPASILAPTSSLTELARTRPESTEKILELGSLKSWQIKLLFDKLFPIISREQPAPIQGKKRRRKRGPVIA